LCWLGVRSKDTLKALDFRKPYHRSPSFLRLSPDVMRRPPESCLNCACVSPVADRYYGLFHSSWRALTAPLFGIPPKPLGQRASAIIPCDLHLLAFGWLRALYCQCSHTGGFPVVYALHQYPFHFLVSRWCYLHFGLAAPGGPSRSRLILRGFRPVLIIASDSRDVRQLFG
jgi:hypothetical protein